MARDVAKIAAALAALLMLGACSSKADKARSEFIGSCASSGGTSLSANALSTNCRRITGKKELLQVSPRVLRPRTSSINWPMPHNSAGSDKEMKMKQIYRSTMILLAALAVTGCGKADEVTKAGDINLAGCEVLAGIKRSEAETITCDKGAKPVQVGSEKAAASEVSTPVVPDAEVIDTALAGEVKRSEGGMEYRDARKSAEGDLTGEGKAEVAVLYTLEGEGGGNGSSTYLAVFQRADGGQLGLIDTTPAAGFGAVAQDLSIVDGKIRVKLLMQGPDDPDCCPSIEHEGRYVLHGGKLLQVQS